MFDDVTTAEGHVPVGSCPSCGVSFAAPADRQPLGRALLLAHRTVCPGGHRDLEVVTPLDALQGV
jgi:hypothetical protein